MTTIPFIVETVTKDLIDVSSFDGHHDLVTGSTTVTLCATDATQERIELDWTRRGDPPDAGSRWLLTCEDGTTP